MSHPLLLGGLVLLTAVVAAALATLAWTVVAARWPERTERRSVDNHGEDLHLVHLTRLLRARDLHEAHRAVVTAVERLLLTRYAVPLSHARRLLGPEVHDFLTAPPLEAPARYRRDLATALTRIEQL